MTDTVTRLLSLADEYANTKEWSSHANAEIKRQTLEAELTRLFTPLSDDEIESLVPWEGDKRNPYYSRLRHARSVERAHGIGGES